MKKILLVEDDAWISQLYSDALQTRGIKVFPANSADEALEILDNQTIDLVLLDMFLPGHNGIEFLHEVASYSDTNKVPIIILSAVSEYDFGLSKENWLKYGVVKYLYKPSTKPRELVTVVHKQLLEHTYETAN